MSALIKNAKKKMVFLAFFLLISMGSINSFANGDGGDDVDIPDIPLDGGLSLLLAAGAAYGGKKLYDVKKRQNKED